MEGARRSLGITDYALNQTTLEQVFVTMAAAAAAAAAAAGEEEEMQGREGHSRQQQG